MCTRFPIDFETYRHEATRLRRDARLSLVRQAAQGIATHVIRLLASRHHPEHGRSPAMAGTRSAFDHFRNA